jgi:hypothetical protein
MVQTTKPPVQSAAAPSPSPFPPLAEYAFLSNRHTGALIAPAARMIVPELTEGP